MFFFPLVQRVLWSKSCPHLALVVPLYIRHACHKKKYNVSLSTCAHTVFQCTLSMKKKKGRKHNGIKRLITCIIFVSVLVEAAHCRGDGP